MPSPKTNLKTKSTSVKAPRYGLRRRHQMELVASITALAKSMREISAKMEEYLFFDADGMLHAKELAGAAKIADSWAARIRELLPKTP